MIGFMRFAPYGVLLLLIAGVVGYVHHEHSQAVKWESAYNDLVRTSEIEAKAAEAENLGKVSIAEENLNELDLANRQLKAKLASLGITKIGTEKELKNAYDKLDNFKSANQLLWNRTEKSGDGVSKDDLTSMLSLCRTEFDETSRRLEAVENSAIFEVQSYNACVAAVKGAYQVVGQQIRFDDSD